LQLTSPSYALDIALLLFAGATPPPVVELTSPVYQAVLAADVELTLEAAASIENGSIASVEFFEGSRLLGSAASPPYRFTATGLPGGPRVFRAKVLATDGRSSVSPPIKCFIAGPFRSGVNLNGPTVELSGNSLRAEEDAEAEGLELGNFVYTETPEQVAIYPEVPTAKRSLVGRQILRASSPNNEAMTIAEPLPNGNYDVFLYLVEGLEAYKRMMVVSIEGQQVASGICHQDIGEWIPYGPYRTVVSDGVLNIDLQRLDPSTTGWTPKIAGYAVHQAAAATPSPGAALDVSYLGEVAVLSFPTSVAANRIETSVSLEADDWQPLDHPVSDFGEWQEIVLLVEDPRRFFRLRHE
jgi:hypothetical protein